MIGIEANKSNTVRESFQNQSPYSNAVGEAAREQKWNPHDSQTILSFPPNGK